MATSAKKAAAKKVAANNNKAKKVPTRVGVIAYFLKLLSEKELTKEQVLTSAAKHFPDRDPKGMGSTFKIQIGGNKPRQVGQGHQIKQVKKEGVIYYQVKLAKATS